jgi:hypothetical protein
MQVAVAVAILYNESPEITVFKDFATAEREMLKRYNDLMFGSDGEDMPKTIEEFNASQDQVEITIAIEQVYDTIYREPVS